MEKVFLLLVINIFSTNVFSQVTFQKVYGGNVYEAGQSIRQTSEGGYILVGRTNSFGAGNFDAYLLKLNNYGDTVWTKTYGGINSDGIWSVLQNSLGEYILSGSWGPIGGGFSIFKTDSNGNLIWSKKINNMDYGFSSCITDDNGYVITGFAGIGTPSVRLIKVGSTGNVVWMKNFSSVGVGWGYSVQQTNDKGFIITGWLDSIPQPSSERDVYLIKTDSTGNVVWAKAYGGPGIEYGLSVQQTNDHGFIIAGYTTSFGAGNSDAYLIKTDSSGNLLWSKTYGGPGEDCATSILQTSDGGYLISDTTSSFGAGMSDACLFKTDANGNLLWAKTYGGVNAETASSIQPVGDGGFILAGTIQNSDTTADMYVIKTDSLGNSGCNEGILPIIVSNAASQVTFFNVSAISFTPTITSPPTIAGYGSDVITLCINPGISEPSKDKIVTIFPNPSTGELRIQNSELRIEKVEIFSVDGKKVSGLQPETSNQKPVTLNVSTLPPGMYFLKLTTETGTKASKFVKAAGF